MAGSSGHWPGYHTDKWERVRLACYRRDMKRRAPCWICGQPIDYQAPAGTPDAWEPDHYLPTSSHPEYGYDPANIRPSHSSCNRSRGARDQAAGDLGVASRIW